jgi:hypothetical protein
MGAAFAGVIMSPLVTKPARNEARKLRWSDMTDILFKTRGDRDWKILEDLGHGNAVACVLQRSRRLQNLLRFFVEERIAYGDRPVPQQRLTEEVLGKEADLSPTSNPHVRIYLRRLRQRVATYYAGPGAADPLVLGVTCGPYRLSVECRRRADAPVTKAPRLKATPNIVVLIAELAASGLKSCTCCKAWCHGASGRRLNDVPVIMDLRARPSQWAGHERATPAAVRDRQAGRGTQTARARRRHWLQGQTPRPLQFRDLLGDHARLDPGSPRVRRPGRVRG